MSAWPEAAWIVKKLQANFDFSQQISNYTYGLNTLNGKVNTLNSTVSGLSSDIDTAKSNLENRAVTIVATKLNNTNVPNTSRSYGQGTIWVVIS